MTLETIRLTLSTTLGAEEWEIDPPIEVPVQTLIAKFIRTPQFNLKELDEDGSPIPYRLMWKEGSRYLRETETLKGAGLAEGHTLVMSFEARAGMRKQ